jgi:hypothetical protein
MAEEFVTIAAYSSLFEAEFFKTILDLEGIESFVIDTNVMAVYPFLAPSSGGVKLQVKKSDAERALETLKKKGHQNVIDKDAPEHGDHDDAGDSADDDSD